jgi:cytochrome c peroxidase
MEVVMRCFLLLVLIVFPVMVTAGWSAEQLEFDEPRDVDLPDGVLPLIVPEENPTTAGKVMLGRKLYFDKRLSSDNTVSCATCHDPRLGFADGKPVAVGIGGQEGSRNSPTTLNAAFYDLQFWDGRAVTLEEQAQGPFTNPVEMGMSSHEAVVEKVMSLPEYPDMFRKVFGDEEMTIDHVVQAIAAFERTLISLNSPFDRFIGGDEDAISDSAKRGWELFNGKARCNTCHGHIPSYPIFTDNKFHNIGVGAKNRGFEQLARRAEQESDMSKLTHEADVSELGRFLVTKKRQDIGAFKTSGLRNIELTAPYMHDGSEPTLESVVEYYDRGGEPNPFLDGGMRPLDLTDGEKRDLVEFMKTLTSDDIETFRAEFAGEMD